MSTPEKFAADITAFVKKAGGNMHAVVRKIVLDVGTSVVLLSPVGNPSKWRHPAPKGYVGGRFRANWQYGLDHKPEGVSGAIDKSGQVSISRLRTGVPAAAAGHVHFITNNLPYAMPLERGWSAQAPAGMVAITVRRFQDFVRKAAQQFGRGGGG